MARGARSFLTSLCYHLINRGLNRNVLFHSAADWSYFVELIKEWKLRCGAKVYHWCLMNNHYHLLAEVQPDGLSRPLGFLQQRYTAYHHRTHGTCGYLWQGRFKSKPVETGTEGIGVVGRYIERNPMRAGLVTKAWEYRWSSARYYVLGEEDGVTERNPYFGGSWTKEQREVYGKQLETFEIEDKGWLKKNETSVIGSEAFRRTLVPKNGHFWKRIGRPKGVEIKSKKTKNK